MYRVIIVEDEMLVRVGLKNSIDWNKFSMCVVADAADGKTALELYEREKPDLIITDLKMPVMSGIDLIARIREKDKTTKIVILTCLEEFELVRKAISMGVSDYIIKLTMTEEQFNAILARVHEELSSNKDRQTPNEISDANINIIKEKAIKDMILYNVYTEREFASIVKKYHLRIRPERMILCILEMDHYNKTKLLFKDENGQLVKDSMLNILTEMLANYGNGEAIHDAGARYIIIFNYGEIESEEKVFTEILSILKGIESSVKVFLNTAVTFGLSNIQSQYSSLNKMYVQALNSLEDRFIGGTGIYGFLSNFDRNKVQMEKMEEMLKLCEESLSNSSVFYNEYSSRIRSIMNSEIRSRNEYLEMFCQLLQWIVKAAKFQGDGSEQIIHSAIKSAQQSENLDEILRCFYEFLSYISAVRGKKRITSKEVKLALDFMESNYSQDLSLQQVASYVGLSTSYLSSLFKKEIDVNFIEYLNEIRIEKAKGLLLETYLKTYEIAETVGFNENTYFCKMFKKVTGTTPGEYRKKWLKQWREEPDDETVHT